MKAYLSPVGFENDLKNELSLRAGLYLKQDIQSEMASVVDLQNKAEINELSQFGRLLLDETSSVDFEPVWAQNIWLQAEWIEVASISDAVKKLKDRQYLWTYYENQSRPHGRAKLIQEKLPKVFSKPVDYSETEELKIKNRALGAFTLISDHLMLASATTSSCFADGEFSFVENRMDPPSRAYLKLWEWFTLYGFRPDESDVCLDLGSCPGGWTWVLSSLFKKVISVDKAPLDSKIAKHPAVSWIKKDAFLLRPDDVKDVNWVFSDIICEPTRILELAEIWMAATHIKHLVFTVKFKGQTDFKTLTRLLDIKGSRARHLVHNKHEVTWWWSRA